MAMNRGSVGVGRQNSELMARIREGMDVYDVDGDHIGDVEDIYFGAEADFEGGVAGEPATPDRSPRPGEGSFVEILADVFDPDEMPETLADRLRVNGYIRIDSTGIFTSDRYVMPDQIQSVDEEGVHLRVRKDSLIKD